MKCYLCPRNCGVDRENGEVGFCGAGGSIRVARYSLHMWEEPVISSGCGSGTIFFSCCNLRCCFCQNYDISTLCKGKDISIDEFSDICLKLQDSGAVNINLVTGCMYVPSIIEGIRKARLRGLNIPIVYNSSGYENVDTIKMLDGIVDIYLPDLKYYDNLYGEKYSGCRDYFKYASAAIDEMYRQVGKFVINSNGTMKRGMIVRHLMLPGLVNDSKKIIKYLYDKYGDNIYISIMNQYTPIKELEYTELNETISDSDYDELINYAYDFGIRNAFIQDGGTQSESFIPDFNEFDGI